ncbi:MAG: hypothetical protein H6813_01330 [Phycisphaeraceae bacterium]|nr:hypothetical protein [Phycisphaeraceae bacterium]MCB9847271.1 hypothetical protein [Phycisphaeraceae bacterium]
MTQQKFSTARGLERSWGGIVSGAGGWRRMASLLVVGALSLTALTGCEDESDQANATVNRAANLMAAVNAGGAESANAPHRADTYEKVIGMLRPVVSSGSGAAKGAAQVITAQAMAGKGRFQSLAAADIEDRCSSLISKAHNEADLFAAHSALAAALSAHDPQPEFDDLGSRTKQVADEIESVRARIRGIDERVAELQKRSGAARDEAASRQRHETELRAEAVHVDAEQRRTLIEQAVRYQRESDAFEAEYVMVDAGIEQLHRTRESVQADLDRLSTQRTLLEEAERNAQLRSTVASDESKEAENKAFEAARRLRNTVREIETLRAGDLADAYNQAESTLDSAASTMAAGGRSDSSRDGKDANSLNEGLIHQALGEVRKSKAAGAASYAALLKRLTELQPDPPERGDYVSFLAKANQQRDEAIRGAEDAFVQAADALERVGGSDAMRDRIAKVVAALRNESPDAGQDNNGALEGAGG